MVNSIKSFRAYLVAIVIIVAVFVVKFYTPVDRATRVETFRGAQLEGDVFYPLMARNINEQVISMYADGTVITNGNQGLYMNDKMQLMIEVGQLTECFSCSSSLYNQNSLIIEKFNDEWIFTLGKDTASYNDKAITLSTPLEQHGGKYYVPVADVASQLGYSYSWNSTDNEAAIYNQRSGEDIYPEKYDLRKRGRTSEVVDQGNTATCWAYASMGALESIFLPEQKLTLSVDGMVMNPAFNLPASAGGEYTMALAYLLSWAGPKLNDDEGAVAGHLQNVIIPEKGDLDSIKKAVFLYGGVQSSLYCSTLSGHSPSKWYSKDNNAYYYSGEEEPNHDIIIIGWDDNYSASNFSHRPEADGAFICQNSWGADFGEDGVFYVSYYDSNIGTQTVIYKPLEPTDNYDAIFQSDLCGWVGSLGYGDETAFAANVFNADADMTINAVGFYATEPDTYYELYAVSGFESEASLNDRVFLGQGTLESAGFYTIPFNHGVQVTINDDFAVVVMLKSPGSVHPIAIEYSADELTENVNIADGVGYISEDGVTWERVEEGAKANVCLKAYGKYR